jgi:hypothetical protein
VLTFVKRPATPARAGDDRLRCGLHTCHLLLGSSRRSRQARAGEVQRTKW